MHNEKQDWGKAYQQIATLILTKIPAIKHVDLYYGQEQTLQGDGNEYPFRAPAVFLQFDAVVEDLGELRQMLTFDIKVYLAFECVQDSHRGGTGEARALQFVALMRQLHEVLHNATGDDFGHLSRVAMTREEAPPEWYFYAQTYRCTLLDYGATLNWTELGEMDPVPAVGLQVDPMPPDDPMATGNYVRIRNSTGSYDFNVLAPALHDLPSITHTDSDGAPVIRPAMVPMVCTPGGVPPTPTDDHYYAISIGHP